MFYNFYTSSETSGISGLSRSGQFCRRKFCSSAKPSPETLWSSKLCRSRRLCSGRKRLQCSPSIFPSWSGNLNSFISSFQDQFLQVVISARANKLAATGSVKICLCGSFINSHGRLLHLYQNNWYCFENSAMDCIHYFNESIICVINYFNTKQWPNSSDPTARIT